MVVARPADVLAAIHADERPLDPALAVRPERIGRVERTAVSQHAPRLAEQEQRLIVREMVEDAETEYAIEGALAKRPALGHIAANVRGPTPEARRAVAEVAPIEIGPHVDRGGAERTEQGPDAAGDVEDVRVGRHADKVAKQRIAAAADSEHGLADGHRGR